MDNYTPPYNINARMLDLISAISEKIGKVSFNNNFESRPHLRRNNRIESIHSSLKIEANSLSLNQVKDIIEGNIVIGDKKEIQEVKNAFSAYKMIPKINIFSIDDLNKLHGIMTHNTVKESGKFRSGEEGVFQNGKCIFVAPPAKNVPSLIKKLLLWLKESEKNIHPLILSSVFHYEFVFIHPYSDGNGRMARLWNTAILYKWRNIFEFIPIESQIEKYQEKYYDSIETCHKNGNSDVFIEFILELINETLDELIEKINEDNLETTEYVKRLLKHMEIGIPYTSKNLLKLLNLKSKDTLRINYLRPALDLGYIKMSLPDKPSSKNQRYIRI
ncbi:MAG: Fic family protein [Coriobacteriia bacterium]|nr:Fic family protein [Coriobacteriia bacterium]